MAGPLRIGRIPYTNLLPIFHQLARAGGPARYEFVAGYPAELNRMVREGAVDVSPSSSIEYLRDPESYVCLPGHSVSSVGAVRSIIFVSLRPLEELDGVQVFVTTQSETSVELLRVVCREFYGTRPRLTPTDEQALAAAASRPAYLAIGDDALSLAARAEGAAPGGEGHTHVLAGRRMYLYDLGELWHRHTGLPFVFALWIALKRTAERKAALLADFQRDLDEARRDATGRLEEIARVVDAPLPAEELAAYWRGIRYDLGEDCLAGLRRFADLIEKD